MQKLKSIKLYFFSILKLTSLSFRNYHFNSSSYNKKLVTFIPDRIFYSPSTHLISSLTTNNNEFYKITNTPSKILWKENIKDKQKFENLHSFMWLSKLDRKNSKTFTKSIIKSWINDFFDYSSNTWEEEITAKRIIAWVSNTDITLENADKIYKENFFISIIKQSNFLLKNIKNLNDDSSKIICCSAIILSGIVFKENDINYKIGIKELERVIKNFFDKNGFPKSRNPEDLFTCFKYFILTREWFLESQTSIPSFLNNIIYKCGECYKILSGSNKKLPLFNGATEVDFQLYDEFLKKFKYKFPITKNNEVGGLVKIKKKNLEFFFDFGNPPSDDFAKSYQAGCLSFELLSKKQKIIGNLGFHKGIMPRLTELSRSTAAHSTLYLNDTSSCIFQKNKTINTAYGISLIKKHKIIKSSYTEDDNFYYTSASHNGYEESFGYIHSRSIKISKKKDTIIGLDILKNSKNYFKPVFYSIRFHTYPGTKVVKTKGGNSVLISLPNGEGWIMENDTNNFEIEKNIFLGNKNKVINNQSISICGNTNKTTFSINWEIKKIN